jgi:hypothetical protein
MQCKVPGEYFGFSNSILICQEPASVQIGKYAADFTGKGCTLPVGPLPADTIEENAVSKDGIHQTLG